MAERTTPDAVLIRNPFTLLYWLFFRGLALRRYARGIHADLDEALDVWEVRSEVGDDPRFRALCRARWILLAATPLCAVLIAGVASVLLRADFQWEAALLFSGGYILSSLAIDALRSRWWKVASHWFSWVTSVVGMLGAGVLLLGFIVGLNSSVAIVLVTLGVTLGVTWGATWGVAVGVAVGVAGGVGLGVGLGVAGGVAFDVPLGVAGGVAFGVTLGVAFGVAFSMALGVRLGVVGGMAFGAALGVIGGMTESVAVGVGLGVAGSMASIIAFLRLPMYLWELPRSLQLSGRAEREPALAAALWRRQPLHYDEVIQLRLIGLPEHIAAIAKVDHEACLEALADAGSSLRQQWAIPQALSLILHDEVQRSATIARIEAFAEETGWLPADLMYADERALLMELRGIGAETAGARARVARADRIEGLRAQAGRLQELRVQLGRADRAALRGFAEPLKGWQQALEGEIAVVEQQRVLIGELPPRYRPGAVLRPGASSFLGRTELFRELEGMLIGAPDKIAPLLLGQPRTGKSSALRQLPLRLGGQAVAVHINMESRATAEHAAGLIGDLVGDIRTAALERAEPVSLPPLDEALIRSNPYRVFENWLKEVEQALGERRWLLLTLDEFDYLDKAVRSGRIDERIFQMIRSIIQYRPRVVLALCGTFTLSECDPRWYDALKNTRNLPVSFLRPEEARRLLTKPAPDFPDNVYDEAAITRALELTSGHPYLLHQLGWTVVNAYNRSREDAPPGSPPGTPLPAAAIDAAVPDILAGGENAFMSIWQWLMRIGSGEQAVAAQLLRALAEHKPLEQIGDPDQRARLLDLYCERDLLATDDGTAYRFRVPLIATWVRSQRRLPYDDKMTR